MVANILKKVLFPIFSLFLAFQSFQLLRYLIRVDPDSFSHFQIFIVSFILTLFITGIFAFIGFAYPSHKMLPKGYYSIKNPTLLAGIYKNIGVAYFRIFLMITFWGKKNNRKKYFNGTKQGLHNFIYQTKQSEFGHFGALVFIGIASIFLLINGHFYIFAWVTLFNILGNYYPIVLQRFHRIRIEKITTKTFI